MKPLIVLIISFLTALSTTWFLKGESIPEIAGNAAMCIMMLFTSIGHFIYSKGMTMMIPDFIPAKRILVWITGIFEIVAALCLLMPTYRALTSYILIVFFILILPANIHAAIKKVDYEKGEYNGQGLSYLWFRVPLQLFFIAWVYYFGIYLPNAN